MHVVVVGRYMRIFQLLSVNGMIIVLSVCDFRLLCFSLFVKSPRLHEIQS